MPHVEYDPVIAKAIDDLRLRHSGGEIRPPATVLEWAERYRRIDGEPFTLANFFPLRALYEDNHPRIAIMKPAQRGVSEFAVTLTCFALEFGARVWGGKKGPRAGLNVGYIFPVQQALNDFSKERISSLREESIHLAQLFSDDTFDSLGFKKIGPSYLYLRGGWSVHALLSFPADVLILDEFDRMDPHAVSLARRRKNASTIRHEVAISTPTVPGKGIHDAYLRSDQRVYLTPCGGCRAERVWSFFEDVRVDGEPYEVWQQWGVDRADTGTITLVCPACGHVQTDAERCAEGRWDITRPEVTSVHGYHIPWWPWPFLDLRALVQAALSDDPTEVQELYRSDLGLPYSSSGSAITEEMLIQCEALLDGGKLPNNGDGPWRDTVLGVDIGARNHYRVTAIGPDGQECVRDMGSVKGWEALDELMFKYRVRLAIVDELPELDASEKFCERWKGRALRATYPSQANAFQGELYKRRKDSQVIAINRTMAMDRVHAQIAHAKIAIPHAVAADREVIDHLIAPVRVSTVDDRGQERHEWVHTKPDHLFHASVYSLVARECLPKAANSFAPVVGGERGLVRAHDELVRQPDQVAASRHGRLIAMGDIGRY